LIGPLGVDETSRIVGSGSTVTAQLTDSGPWRFEAYDATGLVAISVQTVNYRSMVSPIVGEPTFDSLGI